MAAHGNVSISGNSNAEFDGGAAHLGVLPDFARFYMNEVINADHFIDFQIDIMVNGARLGWPASMAPRSSNWKAT